MIWSRLKVSSLLSTSESIALFGLPPISKKTRGILWFIEHYRGGVLIYIDDELCPNQSSN